MRAWLVTTFAVGFAPDTRQQATAVAVLLGESLLVQPDMLLKLFEIGC